MKKLLCALILTALLATLFCAALAATKIYEPDEDDRDYSSAGWYKVYCITPENHDYIYIYDKPSSTKGDSMCRIDDGEEVYVYYTTGGIGKKGTTWAYGTYDSVKKGTTFEGFLRYANLVESSEYENRAPKPTAKPTPKPTEKPVFVTPKPTPKPAAQTPLLETLTVVNCKHWVSLRESPNAESERLAKVPKGAQVVGYYYNRHWYACNYDGVFGYICSDYLD